MQSSAVATGNVDDVGRPAGPESRFQRRRVRVKLSVQGAGE